MPVVRIVDFRYQLAFELPTEMSVCGSTQCAPDLVLVVSDARNFDIVSTFDWVEVQFGSPALVVGNQ